VAAASQSTEKVPLPNPMRGWLAASTERVCVPDSTVTNALSSAVFGLPSSFQSKTCSATRVTVSRQAFPFSGCV